MIICRLIDNLPCATKYRLLDTDEVQYEHGYKLGYVKDKVAYINNHLKFNLKYHTDDNEWVFLNTKNVNPTF